MGVWRPCWPPRSDECQFNCRMQGTAISPARRDGCAMHECRTEHVRRDRQGGTHAGAPRGHLLRSYMVHERVARGEVAPCYVSNPAHLALFKAVANRQREKPDNTVSYFAGAIVDETLRHCLNVGY